MVSVIGFMVKVGLWLWVMVSVFDRLMWML